jgi:hypothetical protein
MSRPTPSLGHAGALWPRTWQLREGQGADDAEIDSEADVRSGDGLQN